MLPLTRRPPNGLILASGALVVAVSAAALDPALVPVAGAAAVGMLVVAMVRARTPGGPLLGGQAALIAAALGVLALSHGGLTTSDRSLDWRLALAVLAYPLLGRALLDLVGQGRQVREADVLVAAGLVGTATGIVLHVAVTSGGGGVGTGSLWADAAGALAALVVGLDVALLVVGLRALTVPEVRRGPVGLILIGITGLLAVHLLQQLDLDRPSGVALAVPAALALLSIGAAALHPRARVEPQRPLADPAPFSGSHAVVIVCALLAAPGALCVQTVLGHTPSAAVATGAMVSGMILASYLVQLLRDRATIEHDATHDGLTGLPNRVLLVDRLERSIAHARRNELAVGVLFVDLDGFKEVNDSLGHAAGDALLQTVAGRLRRCARDEDTVARLSGDEFVIMLPHLGSADEVVTVAERVLATLGDPVTVFDTRLLIAGSIGIAVYPDDGTTAENLLASADAAMYRAKDTPGNHWEIFSPRMATEAHSRMQAEADLVDGIGRDELVLHYQPIIEGPSGRIVGAEALVRWQHPERGLLLPGSFVPMAERSDLIVLLGEKVIFEACREIRQWQDLGFRNRTISVNVAARHFSRGLVSTVTAALRSTGANPENLIIELTESTIIDNLDAVASSLEELRSLGVRAAIDDFGTGYCGLRYLSALPVVSLKIDRAFVQGMTPSDAAIVGATIAMGHRLGLSLTAEGVETVDQQRFLVDQGCDQLQGFLFGRPMPSNEMISLLQIDRSRPEALERVGVAPRDELTALLR